MIFPGEISSKCAPTHEERKWLVARLDAVNRSLAPGNKYELGKAIAQMLILFAPSKSDSDAKMLLTGYVTALQNLSVWAVQAACDDFSRGVGGAREFRPSSAQLHEAAIIYQRDLCDEASDIGRILKAQVVESQTEQQRKDISDRLKALSIELKEKQKKEKADEEFARWCVLAAEKITKQAFERAGMKYAPNKLGPESLKSLGLLNDQDKSQAVETQ